MTSNPAQSSEAVSIRLVDPLDEPEFYCLDVTGWGEHLKLDDPLQAHTCKRNAPDQRFVVDGTALKMPAYGRCLTVGASGEAGSVVFVRPCDGKATQNFAMTSVGRIRFAASNMCLAAGDESFEASGPSHLWRSLGLQPCGGTEKKVMTWTAK